MFSAIFWDNDGVLMETEHLYYQANAEALRRLGFDLTLQTFQDVSLRQGESVLECAPGLSASDRNDLRTWRDGRYRELLADEAAVMPGAEETLRRLHGRLPMAIVTSCRRENFLHMHRASGLLGYFDFILTREDYRNSKPDPEPYLTACRRAGLPPSDCLAIEDSPRGVLSAAAAGLSVAALPGTLNAGGDFCSARWTLADIREVADIVAGTSSAPGATRS